MKGRQLKKQACGLALIVALAGVLVSPARAQDWPLTQDDIKILLIGGAKPDKMIEMIHRRGVNFQMNPDLAKKFHDLGATDEVIDALERAAAKQPSPAGASASPAPPPTASAPGTTPAPAPAEHSATAQTQSAVEQKIQQALAETNSPQVNEADRDKNYPFAPNFRLADVSGKNVSLDGYRGQVVLLNFWATWCPPCRQEIPGLVNLQARYHSQGFQVIGLAVQDERSKVRKFRGDYGMNYPVAMADASTIHAFGVIGRIPTTFLIGRDGRIYNKVIGAPSDLTFLDRWIVSLLGPTEKTEEARNSPPPAPPANSGGPQGSSAKPASTSPPAASVQDKINQARAEKTPMVDEDAPGGVGNTSSSGATANGSPSKAVDLSDPSPAEIQHIIQEFAAKEKTFKLARDNYAYHQINKVDEMGPNNEVVGTYRQDWDILFDNAGKRIEEVTYAPLPTLKSLMVTQEDLNSFRSIQPFVLTTDDLPEYDIKYLGHVKVDYITTYVFKVRPKEIKKGKQYFDGIVWVDDRDLQIVKSEGKPVPELKNKNGDNLFPRFTTYREQIDGKFWFPTYTMADDTLYFPGNPVRIKEIIRYTNYKQFKASSTIKIITALDDDKSKTPEKPNPPKQ